MSSEAKVVCWSYTLGTSMPVTYPSLHSVHVYRISLIVVAVLDSGDTTMQKTDEISVLDAYIITCLWKQYTHKYQRDSQAPMKKETRWCTGKTFETVLSARSFREGFVRCHKVWYMVL